MQHRSGTRANGVLPAVERQENHVMQWPRVFKDASSAVSFADALLNDPGLQSQMSKILKNQVHQNKKNPGGCMDGYQELAETITVELSRCKKPAANFYRYVYGQYTMPLQLADNLAHKAWKGPGEGKVAEKKTIAQCRNLALLLMEKSRQRARYNKRLSMTAIAQSMKIKRQQLYEQWIEEISAIEEEIKRNLDITDHALSSKLEELEII